MPDPFALFRKIWGQVLYEPANSLPDGSKIFEPPLVGFASAADPLFLEFTRAGVVGPVFRPPVLWLPGASTVISYFLPFTKNLRRTNYGGAPASVEWLHGRFRGEDFNIMLRRFLARELRELGGKAVAPALEKELVVDYDNFLCNWSERHAAYAAGLGTFGLNRGLITIKGMAGRFGSVITDLKFAPSGRPYHGPFDYCLYLADGSCGACIKRCPAGAITKEGKDKLKCYRYMFLEDLMKEEREQFGYKHSICGKCQVDVPCEDAVP